MRKLWSLLDAGCGRGLAQPEQYSKDVRCASHQAPVGRIEGYRANFNQNFVILRNGLFHVHDFGQRPGVRIAYRRRLSLAFSSNTDLVP